MSDKIEPALTPEEWAHEGGPRHQLPPEAYIVCDGDALTLELPAMSDATGGSDHVLAGRHRHAAAALALHGQPFGFTREDVKAIRRVLDNSDLCDMGPPGQGWYSPEREAEVSRLNDLAARIEALLPPEGA